MRYLITGRDGNPCAAKTMAVAAGFMGLTYVFILPIWVKDLPQYDLTSLGLFLAGFFMLYWGRANTKAGEDAKSLG